MKRVFADDEPGRHNKDFMLEEYGVCLRDAVVAVRPRKEGSIMLVRHIDGRVESETFHDYEA